MNDDSTLRTTDLDRPRAFAWFSLLAGVLSILLLVVSMQAAAPVGADQLALFAGHRGFIVLTATVVLSWAVFSIPFVAALGQLLRGNSPTFALAATILSAVGILLLGFAIFARIGAFLSILAAGSPPAAADATYQAAIWGNLFYFLTDPGFMTWGLGQLLFGWLAWKSGILPNWASVVGIVGGIAGLLTLAVYQSGVLAFTQLGCFGVWGLVTGTVLFRTRGN